MRRPPVPAVLLLSLLAGSCAVFQPGGGRDMLMAPYLQAITQERAVVLVETGSRDPVAVEFGPTETYGAQAVTSAIAATEESTYVHTIVLPGLSPGSTVHYRVSAGSSTSDDAVFRTACLPGVPFQCAWMADTRKDTTVHDSIASQVERLHPSFLLFGGDMGPTSRYSSFKTYFFRPIQQRLFRSVPFYNATGNHERWGVNTIAFTEAPPSASGTEEYYAFDWGDMHVLVLNTEVPYGPGSAQFAFALRDLSTTRRQWKIVSAHKPAYCGGGHGEDEGMKTLTREVFEPHGVAMVIAGHSHFFEHNLVHGIHHMVIGSAGAPLYMPEPAPYTVASAKSYNWALMSVGPAQFRMMVYDERGGVLDSLTLHAPGH